MDQPSASRKSGKISTRRQFREAPAVANPEDKILPTLGASGGSHTRVARRALGMANQEGSRGEELDSTFSFSLGLSSGEDNRAGKGIRMRGLGLSNRPGREEINQVIEKLVADANREIQEIERRRKGKSVETAEEAGTQQRTTRQVVDIHDLTETDDEDEAAPRGWKNLMEEEVDTLIEVSAAQHELMEGQKRQMTKVANLIDRVISWREEEHRPSHPTSPVMRRKPRPTATTNRPFSAQHGPSAAKKARHSGSHGSLRRN